MKSLKVSFDFSSAPEVLQLLRMQAVEKGMSQKAMLIEALERYFAQDQEDAFLKSAADKTFSEWNNSDDTVYDDL